MEYFISVIVTATFFLLTGLLYEIRAMRKKQDECVTNAACNERRGACKNEEDHKEIWERMNHHRHNGEGRVVVS